jgi:hypothetical protein
MNSDEHKFHITIVPFIEIYNFVVQTCFTEVILRPKNDILPMSHGEIWTAHGGVNPCGLIVRRGDREIRTRWLC